MNKKTKQPTTPLDNYYLPFESNCVWEGLEVCDRTQREAEGEDVAGRRDQKEKEITGIVNKE